MLLEDNGGRGYVVYYVCFEHQIQNLLSDINRISRKGESINLEHDWLIGLLA